MKTETKGMLVVLPDDELAMTDGKALALAYEIREMNSRGARWVASDAIRELESEKVRERLFKKEEKRKRKIFKD